jgi:hypothetical protein
VNNLSSHPETKALLQLELDTLGEDWLLALQDELTKPYFISVRRVSLRINIWVGGLVADIVVEGICYERATNEKSLSAR